MLSLSRESNAIASGTRLSTTRYIRYAKISVKMSAIPHPGAITTFITMSDRKDEIDWEILGKSPYEAQTNVFYKGITEYEIHGSKESVRPGVAASHIYTIDWKSDSIAWSIDGRVKRTLYKHNSTSTLIPKRERWFPSTPSRVQISVWDGGSTEWAGGPVQFHGKNKFNAFYEYIDIQCYDSSNRPVDRWPRSQ